FRAAEPRIIPSGTFPKKPGKLPVTRARPRESTEKRSRETCSALHLYAEIVGKYRLARTPWINHSWHATYYVNARGLTTSLIPDAAGIEIIFDLVNHVVLGEAADGRRAEIRLGPMSVAEFHMRYREVVSRLGGRPAVPGRPKGSP